MMIMIIHKFIVYDIINIVRYTCIAYAKIILIMIILILIMIIYNSARRHNDTNNNGSV